MRSTPLLLNISLFERIDVFEKIMSLLNLVIDCRLKYGLEEAHMFLLAYGEGLN